jgi:hypothetical protein
MARPDPPAPTPEPPKQPDKEQARIAREAAALRENLLRRKQQARARADEKPSGDKT